MSPLFNIYESGDSGHLVVADLRDRLTAQLIDGLILGLVCSSLMFLLSAGKIFSLWVSPVFPFYLLQVDEALMSQPEWLWWGGHFFRVQIFSEKLIAVAYPAPLLWLIYAAYYGVFSSVYGQTPGKMLKKLVVLDVDKRRLSPLAAFGRWATYAVAWIPIGENNWLSGSLRKDKQLWHDHLSDSVVYSFNR